MIDKTGRFGPVTEWIERHPRHKNLLYAFTSFWSESQAVVTTFSIVDQATGRLAKLGESVKTGGLHAVHAVFSPSGDTLCVAHHNDGNVSFFDCSQPDQPLVGPPVCVLETPAIVPDTRTAQFPQCLPSIHHAWYHHNKSDTSNGDGDYLLTSDASRQGRVWTYAVDDRGMPVSKDSTSNLKVTYARSSPGWLARTLGRVVMGMEYRIRRAVTHPNGRYVYILMEINAVLQVYECDADGRIYGDCLQEIPTIDPAYFDGSKWTGMSLNAPGELVVTDTEVFVSNRGLKAPTSLLPGRTEESVRIFRLQEEGRKVVPQQCVETKGPIRHFWLDKDAKTLFTATHVFEPFVVEKFVRQDEDGMFAKVGEADVGMEVVCLCVK